MLKGIISSKGQGLDNRPENINRNGRPPKLLSAILRQMKEAGYERVGPTQVVEAYEFLFGMDVKRLKEYALDEDQPMLLRMVAKAMLSPKGIEMLEKMLDRAHGKAAQKNEFVGKDGTGLFDSMPVSKSLDELIRQRELMLRTVATNPIDSEPQKSDV